MCEFGIILIISDYEVCLLESAAPVLMGDIALGKTYVKNATRKCVKFSFEEEKQEEVKEIKKPGNKGT